MELTIEEQFNLTKSMVEIAKEVERLIESDSDYEYLSDYARKLKDMSEVKLRMVMGL